MIMLRFLKVMLLFLFSNGLSFKHFTKDRSIDLYFGSVRYRSSTKILNCALTCTRSWKCADFYYQPNICSFQSHHSIQGFEHWTQVKAFDMGQGLKSKHQASLLLAPYLGARPDLLVVKNASIYNFPLKIPDRILAITYLFSTKTLLVSYMEQKTINAFINNSSEPVVVQKNIVCDQFANDEASNVIAMIVARGKNHAIGAVDNNGKNFHPVFSGDNHVLSISTCPKHNTIYASTTFRIVHISYDGEYVVTLSEKTKNARLCHNTHLDTLFFNRDSVMYAMKKGHKEYRLFTFSNRELPRNMMCYEDKVYVSFHFAETIAVVENNTYRTFVVVPKGLYSMTMYMESNI